MKDLKIVLLVICAAFFALIGSSPSNAFGEGLIGDDVESVLIPRYSTSTVTPFTALPVQVSDPGIEFFGELSTTGYVYNNPTVPFTYSVSVDVFSDYFTVTAEATNEWLTEDGYHIGSFGIGGDSASMYDIQISDLDLPGGIGPVEFDPSRSAGFIVPDIHIREITWDTDLKQVNVRFAWVKPSATFAFSLQGANSADADDDGIPDYLDECPDVFGEEAYSGCQTPQTDRDGDGIPNEDDLCPDVFGFTAHDGCPRPGRTEPATIDLVLEQATYSASPRPGAGWNLPVYRWEFFPAALVANRGTETANKFDVIFILEGFGAHHRIPVTVRSLEPGESRWVYPPRDSAGRGIMVPPGEYTLRAVCDINQLIPEQDESNNVYQVPVVLASD